MRSYLQKRLKFCATIVAQARWSWLSRGEICALLGLYVHVLGNLGPKRHLARNNLVHLRRRRTPEISAYALDQMDWIILRDGLRRNGIVRLAQEAEGAGRM